MVHPNDETLSFTALMIKKYKQKFVLYFTLIFATHSNINNSDFFISYHYKTSTKYKTLCYRKTHNFGKMFIDPLHLRLINPTFGELLRYL